MAQADLLSNTAAATFGGASNVIRFPVERRLDDSAFGPVEGFKGFRWKDDRWIRDHLTHVRTAAKLCQMNREEVRDFAHTIEGMQYGVTDVVGDIRRTRDHLDALCEVLTAAENRVAAVTGNQEDDDGVGKRDLWECFRRGRMQNMARMVAEVRDAAAQPEVAAGHLAALERMVALELKLLLAPGR